MRSARRWVSVVAATSVAGLLAAGCGGGGSDAAVSSGDGSTTTSAVAGLQAPGAEIGGGLVVPEGAQLAGAAFPWADEQLDASGSDAHLVIDGDPFAVWDALAAQLRELHPDAPFPGSADSCAWRWEERVEDGGRVVTLDGTDEDDQLSEQERLDRQRVTADAPPGTLAGVECYASASYATEAGLERTGLQLAAGADRHASLAIDVMADAYDTEPGTTAQLASVAAQLSPTGEVPPPSLEAVPAGAADHVPASLPSGPVGEGDPFGSEVNCFSGSGYTRTLLPAGATWVADLGYGDVSVLAVDDPRAVIEALQGQFESGGPDESSGIRTVELDDGASILTYAHSVSAGGGGCSVRSSPDGRYLRVERNAD